MPAVVFTRTWGLPEKGRQGSGKHRNCRIEVSVGDVSENLVVGDIHWPRNGTEGEKNSIASDPAAYAYVRHDCYEDIEQRLRL